MEQDHTRQEVAQVVALALQETMEQKYTFLLCIALAVVHHRYDAEDAVQNARYKAWQHLEGLWLISSALTTKTRLSKFAVPWLAP